ncbi:MAG: SDR family oxidoreductase [Pseudomonadota bacterium]
MRLEPVLVTGATGYVGGRLVPRLLNEGFRVRAMARSMEKLAARTWANHPLVELVQADVMELDGLNKACQGCWAAYYLIHSMDPGIRDFSAMDRRGATNMAAAAAEAGMARIIYLGGLAPARERLSPHLQSRAEVGRILSAGRVPVAILRAAMILGSGSASFEIMRYLMDRLPLLPAPVGIRNHIQPISIRNVVGYLAGCLEHDEVKGRVFDICGPEVLTYEELFKIYAEEAGLRKRWIVPSPLITVGLSARLISLVTPVNSALARPLTEGLRNEVICADNSIRGIIPQDLMDCRRTIKRILVKKQQQIIETAWTDAGLASPQEWVQLGDEEYSGGAVISAGYRVTLRASPERVWRQLTRIGGESGWLHANFLWRWRGRLDKLCGGVGLRGRRNADNLCVGDALDFWRVFEIRPQERLLLVAELKTPGEAVLDFRISRLTDEVCQLSLTSRFLPRGLWGLAYWYALLPFHIWIFRGLLTALARRGGLQITAGPEKIQPGAGGRDA